MICEICENCGKPIKREDMIISVKNGENINIFCSQCAQMLNTCKMCEHNTPCGFFNDPDPMPQFVMVARRIQQGNTTFVTQMQVPNGERIKKFCLDGKCKCAIDDPNEPLCCRFGGCTTCTNYCEREQFNFVQDFSMAKAKEN